MSLRINHWKRRFYYLIWVVALALIVAFFAKVYFYERNYYATKEGSSRALTSTTLSPEETVDETEVTEPEIRAYTVAPDRPRYLSIAKLNVKNARIIPVGVKPNGELGTPSNIFDVGWYSSSSLPGQGGTILIDGHNGGPNIEGVFKHLPDLVVGDIITIERGDGAVFNYQVVENTTVTLDKADDYMATAISPTASGKESLTLISCTGEWSIARRTYLSRQFVRADLQ